MDRNYFGAVAYIQANRPGIVARVGSTVLDIAVYGPRTTRQYSIDGPYYAAHFFGFAMHPESKLSVELKHHVWQKKCPGRIR